MKMVTSYWILFGLLVYSYIGYPAMLWLIVKFAGHRSPPSGASTRPRITLIVPAYNEEAVIRHKLQNSLALAYPADLLEIIVVDDGSSDATAEIAGSFTAENLKVIRHSSRCGKASAINSAVRTARGSLLCLCDANATLSGDALTRLVAWMSEPNVGAVTGLVQLDTEDSEIGRGEELYYRLERWIQRAENRLGSLLCVDGGMYLVRADLIPSLEVDTILDDFAISMSVLRRGYQIRYAPEATANETGTQTGEEEYHRRSRLAAGYVQALKRCMLPSWRRPWLLWQFVSHKLLRWLGPLLLGGLLIVNSLIASCGTVYTVALVCQVMVYVGGLFGSCSSPFRRTTIGSALYYFTLSQWSMALGLTRGLFNRQSVAWAKAERNLGRIPVLDAATGENLG